MNIEANIPKSRKFIALGVSVGINLTMGINYSYSVINKSLEEQLHWSSTQATLPYTIYTILFSTMMFFAGKMQDRYGPRKVASVGSILLGGGMAACGFFTCAPTVMALVYGLSGIGTALCFSVTIPSSAKWFPPAKRGAVTGIVVGGIALAALYFSPIANYLLKVAGVSEAFWILGGMVFCLLALFSQFLRNPPTSSQAAPHQSSSVSVTREQDFIGWPDILFDRSFQKLWLAFLLSASAALLILVHIAEIAKVQANWENGFYLVMIFSVFNTSGRLIAGYLSDIFSHSHIMMFFFALNGINTLFFGFYLNSYLLGFGAALTGLSYGAYYALFPVITADRFGMRNFGGNYGLVFTAWGAAGFLGPILGGKVIDMTGTYQMAYVIAAFLLCGAGGIVLTMRNETRSTPLP